MTDDAQRQAQGLRTSVNRHVPSLDEAVAAMASLTEEELVANVARSPWSYVLIALGHELAGKTAPDVVEHASYTAATLLGAAMLHEAGVTDEELDRLFGERPYTVVVSYDPKTDELGINIEWTDDGTKLTVGQPRAD